MRNQSTGKKTYLWTRQHTCYLLLRELSLCRKKEAVKGVWIYQLPSKAMTTIKTADFPLICFSLCKGSDVEVIDRSDSRKILFELRTQYSEEELKKLFWGNEQVGVRDFVNAMHQVKQMIHHC